MRHLARACGLAAFPILFSACGDKSAPSTASSTAPATATSAAATPGGSGKTATLAQLDAFTLPKPPKMPEDAEWKNKSMSRQGDRDTAFRSGDKYYLSARILDCRAPQFQGSLGGGDLGPCTQPGTEKLKGHDLYKPNDVRRSIKIGHIVVHVSIAAAAQSAKLWSVDDLDAYVASLDFSTLEKLDSTVEPSRASSAAPAATPAATAAPAGAPVDSAKCPPDRKLEVPGICIKLAPSFKAEPVKSYTSGGEVSLVDGSSRVRISWVKRSPPVLAEGVKEMESSVAHGKNAVWGDTAGKGRWVRYDQDNGATMELSAVVAGDLLVSCAAQKVPGACPSVSVP